MERFADHLVTLDLSDDELADAPGTLRRAAVLSSGTDAALLRLIADQLDEARTEGRDPVDVEFTTRGEQAEA